MELGKQVRLNRLCAHASGRFCSVAVEHFIGYQDGPPAGLVNPPATIAEIVADSPDCGLCLQLPVPPHQWLAGGLVVAGAVLCQASVAASAHVTARPTGGGRGRGERPTADPDAPPSSAD